jgi:hypothetical protein
MLYSRSLLIFKNISTLICRLSLNIMTLSITTNRGCYTKLGVDIEVTGVAQVI